MKVMTVIMFTHLLLFLLILTIQGGELFEYVLSHRSLGEDTARNLFAQLISSVKYMHVKGIAHRDLKLVRLEQGREPV